jgi:hypothetical protein
MLDGISHNEICIEASPDNSQGDNGWKFAIISAVNYQPNPLLPSPLFLRASDGEEIGISIAAVANSGTKSDRKRITFTTLIADSK